MWSVTKISTALSLVGLSCLTGALPSLSGHSDPEPFFHKGFDLSSLKIMYDGYGPGEGATYKDSQRGNITRGAAEILRDGGMNTVRLRLWVWPKAPYDDGYYVSYGLNYTLPLAKHFYDMGFKIYLDYFFSDYWADPGKQATPEEWPTTLDPLAATLREYVTSTLMAFHEAGVDLSIVALGNEIRHGMLWPLGYVNVDTFPTSARVANFSNFAYLWSEARNGVRDAVAMGVQSPQVMIHIDDGWNTTLQTTWFSALTATGKVSREDWDIFGFSFYPFYGTSATYANLQTTLDTLANEYNKPLHVVETDWPYLCPNSSGTGTAVALSEPSIPVSVAGQIEWMRGIINVVKSVPRGLGQGVNYWEPAWLNNTGLGSACESNILFSTDWSEFPKVTAYSLESVNMYLGV